jgi:hypothetical protein
MYPADNASEQEKDGKKDGSWVLAGFVICALSGATVTLFVSWGLRHFINPS